MKNSILSILGILLVAILPVNLNAQTYVADTKIALPGDGGWDYLSVDNVNHRLYVSHGNRVNVVDLKTGTAVGSVDSLTGVHGIAIANDVNRGFISDGRANAVVVFDLGSLKTISKIQLTGKNPDAIIYDPYSKKVYAFNGGSSNISIIDPNTLQETGQIAVGGRPEFAAADGKGRIYNNLEDKNQIAVIDTKTNQVVAKYDLAPCVGPTGLAYDAQNDRLFVGCGDSKLLTVVDAKNGKVITSLPIGNGVDAVSFDPGSKLIFSSNGDGTTTIIKQLAANDYRVVQNLNTQTRARTMTLDPSTHKIYLSVAEVEQGTRRALPGTFAVLAYKMQ